MEMRLSSPLWGQCTQYANRVLAAVSTEIVKKRLLGLNLKRLIWSKLVYQPPHQPTATGCSSHGEEKQVYG